MRKLILLFLIILPLNVFAEGSFLDSFNEIYSEEAEMELEQIEEPTITFLNSKLTIENARINSIVEIYSLVGNRLFHAVMEETSQYFIVDLPKGYYFVKVGNTTRKISVK
ncbi:MAG: T9SS type A sorting domain-containing protein [Paludibacteraceae bacterium]|nr:T9SS type A sorting domain-containing protein [Paludibacteraceae bacterium]